MIVLKAIMTAKKGNEAKIRDLGTKMVQKVKDEKETLEYRFNQSISNSCKFFFFEKYVDQNALNYHSNTDYFKAIVGEIASLLEKEPEVELYEEIASIH